MAYKFRKNIALTFRFSTIFYVYVVGGKLCVCDGDHLISRNEELEN